PRGAQTLPQPAAQGLPGPVASLGGAELLARAAGRHGRGRIRPRRRHFPDGDRDRSETGAQTLVPRALRRRVHPGRGGRLERRGHHRRHPDGRGHLARLRSRGRRPGARVTRALVTGGAGFIGSNLVRALLQRGDEVRVLDNFSTGSRANLEELDVDIVEGELRSYERVHNAVRGTEIVYHLGALGSVPRSVQDPLTSSAPPRGPLPARAEGLRPVVSSPSPPVYGPSRTLPTREDSPPDPISPYGVAKLAAERYCIAFSRVYEAFETVVLLYFNVFGPRQSPFSQYAAVVPLFITAISDRRPAAPLSLPPPHPRSRRSPGRRPPPPAPTAQPAGSSPSPPAPPPA